MCRFVSSERTRAGSQDITSLEQEWRDTNGSGPVQAKCSVRVAIHPVEQLG